MQELKNNPIISILLAIITVLSAAMFSMTINYNNQLWNKLDRVTSLLIQERDILKGDLKDTQKLVICHDREIAELKERINGHMTKYNLDKGVK